MESIKQFISEHPLAIIIGIGSGFVTNIISDSVFLILVLAIVGFIIGWQLDKI